jgi:sugar/nucleoside kinase (ribokinase family)
MTLLAVGSVAFDSIKTPYGEAEKVVGGSATYFSLTASFFTDVAVLAVVGEDFGEEHFRLFADKGIDTRQVKRTKGKSFFWKGEYGQNLNEAKTLSTELNVFADFRPDVLSDYRETPFLFLGNIDPDLQNHVLNQMKRPLLVGLDTMNFWISGKADALARVLARVDVLLINEGEARMLSGENNLMRAMRKVSAMGPRAVIVKRGEYGSVAFMDGSIFMAPAYPLESIADPTGAGDCFAGGFMGYLANRGEWSPGEIRRAVLYGTTMASFNIEKFSVDRLISLTFPEIRARFEHLQSMIAI